MGLLSKCQEPAGGGGQGGPDWLFVWGGYRMFTLQMPAAALVSVNLPGHTSYQETH